MVRFNGGVAMKNIRIAVLSALLAIPAACGGGGSSGGGAPPAPPSPPPPPVPVITGPLSPLPPAFHNVPISTTNFTGTGTGIFDWTVTAGSLPPGVNLSPSGVYSGTPTSPGSFTFSVTLTDDDGTDTNSFTQVVLASVSETEPNDVAADASLLPSGVPGTGALGADDVDLWEFSATANQVIQVEVFATRRDFDNWQNNVAIPKISLIDVDGTSFLAGIDYFAGTTTGWYGGAFDLDIPRFRIPANGTYFVRLEHDFPSTPGGEYALRVSALSLGVLQLESEDNDTPGTADAITAGTLRALREDEDDDWYSITITAPTLVYFEVSCYRNGLFGIGGVPDDDYFDPQIQLFDTDGTTLLASNDDVFFFDSAIHFLITTSGTYFLQVTESINFLSDGDAEYYLTYTPTAVGSEVEAESNDLVADATPIAYDDVISGTVETGVDDLDFYSFSGNAGDMVRVFFFDFGANQAAVDFIDVAFMLDDSTFIQRAINYPGVGSMACARAILPSTGTFYIRVTPQGGATNYTIQLVLHLDADFEVESNDTPGLADPIPGFGRVAGVIDTSGDVDVFSFSAIEGEIVNFSVHAAMGAWAFTTGIGYMSHNDYGSFMLPDLEIINSSGTVLDATPIAGANFTGESMTNGLATSGITFRAPTAGTFYVRVISDDGLGGPEYLYLLERD